MEDALGKVKFPIRLIRSHLLNRTNYLTIAYKLFRERPKKTKYKQFLKEFFCRLTVCLIYMYLTGQRWREKTLACFDFVIYFLSGSSTSLPDLRNVGAFFNTQNTKSEVHSLACHDGSACIENIQLHSLLRMLNLVLYWILFSFDLEMYLKFQSWRNKTILFRGNSFNKVQT